MRPFGSLRTRLAALIFLAVAVPVVVVALVSVRVTRDADVVVSGPTTVDIENVETRVDPVAEQWVWGTVAIVLVIAGLGAWFSAGRIVRPIQRIQRTADEIEADDLSRRIDVDRGADELVALAASFDRMLDRLEGAAKAQRDFVAHTSHELRTPLAVLQTNIDLLLQNPDADLDAHREAADTTRRSVARLRTLVDDLLLTARAGARRLDHDPIPARDLLADLIAERTPAERDRLLLPADTAGPVIAVDGASIGRAVRNLIDNALERSPGPVALGMGEVDGWCGLGVRDAGGGIDPDLHASIFEPYVSGSGSTGLGLAIADQVARAHGGALTSRSMPEQSTTFVLWVPVSPGESPVPAGVDPTAHAHSPDLEHRLVWGRGSEAPS